MSVYCYCISRETVDRDSVKWYILPVVSGSKLYLWSLNKALFSPSMLNSWLKRNIMVILTKRLDVAPFRLSWLVIC